MEFKNGCYIGAYFVNDEAFELFYSKFKDRLIFLLEELERKYLPMDVKLPDDPPHVTLMYSSDIPAKEPKIEEFAHTDIIKPAFLGYEIFPYGEELSIVALLDSVVLFEMHNRIKSLYGLTPTYHDYKPHITLLTFSKEHELFVREKIKKASSMTKNDMEIFKDEPLKMTFKIEDLDPK